MLGETPDIRPVRVHLVDLEDTVAAGGEGDLAPVWGPGRVHSVIGEFLRVQAIRIHHPDFRIAAGLRLSEGIVGDLPAIMRPYWTARVSILGICQSFLRGAVGI